MRTDGRLRTGRARRWLGVQSGRVLELVGTDVLQWSAATPPRQPALPVGLEVREVTAATAWEEAIPEDRRRRVRPFLRRGDTGFIALADGELVGEIWLSRTTHRDPWSGLLIRLAADEGYAYALWVAEDYRSRGVPRALMATLLRSVSDDPVLTRVYGWVDRRNRESQMLLRLLGFTDVQTVRRVHLLHRRGRQLPRSDHPPFGPLSRRGRHSDEEGAPVMRES